MDLDSIEGLNEIRPSVYRVAMKLLFLQRLSHMDTVSLQHITAAFQSAGGAMLQQEVELNRQEVTQTLNRMFHIVSQEVPGHVTSEETCSLMFRLNDRNQTGFMSRASLQTSLIALSSENLLVKYRALVSVVKNSSGSVSRSGLRSLLQDLNQVPAAVQEEEVFGGVEAAVRSCFNGVLTPTVSEGHVLSWLQSEPCLLLWLPTLYRLSVSQSVSHTVRCHTCKTLPITGLRYRCMKCVNVHLCQSCFLTDRQTRKHKTHHPVLEFCTQPTWRESLSLLVHSARHAMLPRRYTRREADRRSLMREELGQVMQDSAPPSGGSTRLAASAVNQVSHDAPPSCSSVSKALQTDESPPEQASVLLTEVRNLQRDKWLMEQQLQVWRLTVQSEQGILEDRCSEMEVTMETLREHNLRLQRTLTQALSKMETHTNNMPTTHQENMKNDENMENLETSETNENMENLETSENLENLETSETNENMENLETSENSENLETSENMENLWGNDEEEPETTSPTMHQNTPLSHDIYCEEGEPAGHWFLCRPIGQQYGSEEAWPQEEDPCVSEKEDCGTCSPEELLQETVEGLRAVMETDRWTERQTGERNRAELLQAAEQVGDSIHHLVDTVRTGTL